MKEGDIEKNYTITYVDKRNKEEEEQDYEMKEAVAIATTTI